MNHKLNPEERTRPEDHGSPAEREWEAQLRQTDHAIGVAAQLAEADKKTPLTPTEQLAAEQKLARVYASPTWRVGQAVLLPMRLVRRPIQIARRAVRAVRR